MKIDWHNLGAYWYGNRLAIISGTMLLITSAVKTLPQPGTTFAFYTFFYDWAHQFLNITNNRLTTTPAIAPLAPSAEPVTTTK